MSRPPVSFRQRAIAGLLAAAALAIVTDSAAAETIEVVVDRAKVMRIAQPADVVIIGNPAIADATIQDSQTLIITGRSFGTTNIIVLDAAGQAIADEVITVGPQDDNIVTVYRRASRQTLSCTPECSPTLAVGDDQGWFDSVSGQMQQQVGITDAASGR
jgi:Flp pilus assembly secretin CpaC